MNRIPYERYAWHQRVPIRPSAMALAPGPDDSGRRLLVAGTPDRIDPEDPLATFEGKGGGLLWVMSGADGKKLSELSLGSPPVWDGMALANGRLYVATRAGQVLCLAGKR